MKWNATRSCYRDLRRSTTHLLHQNWLRRAEVRQRQGLLRRYRMTGFRSLNQLALLRRCRMTGFKNLNPLVLLRHCRMTMFKRPNQVASPRRCQMRIG